MTTLRSRSHAQALGADVLVVGGGLVGLACAVALAERGTSVIVFSRRLPGEASRAAAGLLAPSLEPSPGTHEFAVAGRDYYPTFVEQLRAHTGIPVSLDRRGILEVGTDAAANGPRIAAAELRELEPALHAPDGALLHPLDGAVDNVRLVDAVAARVALFDNVRVIDALVEELSLEHTRPMVITAAGERAEGSHVVLAAGAWLPWIRGLPGRVPIEPIRGQMLALGSSALGHAVFGPDAYLVPRGQEVLVGSTMERVGLDVGTTPEALEALRGAAIALCPSLEDARVTRAWSGLRPCTPDLLPILGRHPADDRVLLACGHSRSGILLGPISGAVIADLAVAAETPWDLSPFSLKRFD